MLEGLLQRAKKHLRGPYHEAQTRYVRWRHGFGPAELLDALREAGIGRGDRILVHSGLSDFAAFEGKAADIAGVFREAVGPEGSLLMPTLSMAGSALDFARSGRIFDPRTTPSQMGLISEVFRRLPDVARSIHPTHSVAAWGADRDWWLEGHHLAATPCGRGTPFHRLLEREAKIVLAGTGIATMTFFHCAEELLETRMPFNPFTSERYVMRCRVNGAILETAPMRLYAPDVSRRRCLAGLEAELRAQGRWRESRRGTFSLAVLTAAEVWQTLDEMAGRGVFCYRDQ